MARRKGPRGHSGHRKHRRRGAGRAQTQEHAQHGITTVWQTWSWEAWEQARGEWPPIEAGEIAITATLLGNQVPDEGLTLAAPFGADECAACAFDSLKPEVDEKIAELTGTAVAELLTSAMGITAHGVTLGVLAARRAPRAA